MFHLIIGQASAFAGCGKIPKVSFRERGLPEESAFFFGLAKKQIPRFARDDIKLLFSAAFKAMMILTNCGHDWSVTHRQSRVILRAL
jgi:hypothetical protein